MPDGPTMRVVLTVDGEAVYEGPAIPVTSTGDAELDAAWQTMRAMIDLLTGRRENSWQMEDDWDPEESSVTECPRCGEVRLCKTLTDPYLREVYEERRVGLWCYPCFRSRKDDI